MAADLKPVYLLAGNDRPKVGRALGRLRSHFAEGAIELRSAGETSGEEAVAACNALGLFGEGRLVIVGEVDRWKADDARAIAAYLASPAPATVLALAGEEIRRDSPLAKACAKAGDVLVYDVSKRNLPKWVGEQFARLGADAEPAACRALVELVGDDSTRLTTEIDKLATWAGGDPIGEREVELLSAGGAERSRFALTDAWGRRDLPALLAECEALLERSGDPLDRVLPALVGILRSHIALVGTCRVLDAEGVRPRDAAARLKKHPFSVEKAFAHARNFSADELRDALVRLAALDLATKGGSRLPRELELERALVEMTRLPEAAAEAGTV